MPSDLQNFSTSRVAERMSGLTAFDFARAHHDGKMTQFLSSFSSPEARLACFSASLKTSLVSPTLFACRIDWSPSYLLPCSVEANIRGGRVLLLCVTRSAVCPLERIGHQGLSLVPRSGRPSGVRTRGAAPGERHGALFPPSLSKTTGNGRCA